MRRQWELINRPGLGVEVYGPPEIKSNVSVVPLSELEAAKRLLCEVTNPSMARAICAEVSGLSPEIPEDVHDVLRALRAIVNGWGKS